MSAGHDTKCSRCKGAGEVLTRRSNWNEAVTIPGEKIGTESYKEFLVPVECSLCTGTGLVELDDYWEHA